MIVHAMFFVAGLALGAVFSTHLKELWAYATAKVTAAFSKRK